MWTSNNTWSDELEINYMRFYFFLRRSEEKIWECVAENKQAAWSFFSQRKRLNVKALKNLYTIKN